jgi:hypothetical protein
VVLAFGSTQTLPHLLANFFRNHAFVFIGYLATWLRIESYGAGWVWDFMLRCRLPHRPISG